MAAAILFLQPRPGSHTEQLGCFAMNIWQAAAMVASGCWVEPAIPFAPRDNGRVEAHPDESWETSILAYYTRPASDIFSHSDSGSKWTRLEDFYNGCGGRANMSEIGKNTIVIHKEGLYEIEDHCMEESYRFTHCAESPYKICKWPRRWDLTGERTFKDFFLSAYKPLPFRLGCAVHENRATIHWRRGDRGNYSLGEDSKVKWQKTDPVRFASWASKYLIESVMPEVAILTNSGSKADMDAFEKTLVEKGYAGKISWILSDYSADPLLSWKKDLAALDDAAGSKLILLSPGGVTTYGSAFGRILVAETLRRGVRPVVLSA